MFWIRLFIFASAILFVVFFITQIWIPAFLGRKWFPLFRKAEIDLNSQITELKQQLHEEDLKSEVSDLQHQLEAKQAVPVTPETSSGSETETQQPTK